MTCTGLLRSDAAQLRGSALIVVLWAMVILGVVAAEVLQTTTLGSRMTKNYGDEIQARYLAIAGIEKAKALIYKEKQDLAGSRDPYSTTLFDDANDFQDVPLGRGIFRIYRQGTPEEGGGRIYGIVDETGRLDINSVPLDELQKLPDMTPDVAASIVDWRDTDSQLTPQGAEADYYLGLDPPYRIRNGPFETLRELLMVRGVTPDLLLGEDANGNGILDPAEDDGSFSPPNDDGNGMLSAGWSAYLTLDTMSPNKSFRGEPRVNVTSATSSDLQQVDGIDQEIADSIVAFRGKGSLHSIANLLDVTKPPPPTKPGQTQKPASGQNPQGGQQPGQNPSSPQPAGSKPADAAGKRPSDKPAAQQSTEKVIDSDLLVSIADSVTTTDETDVRGLVNINAAGEVVLACLPSMDEDLARAVLDYRQRNGYFHSVAELLDVPGITTEIFKKLCPRITVRSGTFRITSEGLVTSTRARKRIQVIVQLTDDGFETISYQEDP